MVFGLSLPGRGKKGPAEPPPRSEASSAKAPSNAGGKKGALTVNEFVARTKKCRERGLEPTKPELIAYARYLGIDPVVDGDLMWVADEALNAPLPSEWTEHHDSADRVFYYNVQTRASSWTHPLEQLHRDTYKAIVNFRSGKLDKEEQQNTLERLRRKCEEAERDAHKELQAWTEHLDDQGQQFFYNHDQQCSVWTDPRPAQCHSLYLQMKTFRVLRKICAQSKNGGRPEPLGNDSNRGPASDSDSARHQSKKPSPRSLTEGAQSGDEGPGRGRGIDSMDEDAPSGKEKKRKKHKDKESSAKHSSSLDDDLDEIRRPKMELGRMPLASDAGRHSDNNGKSLGNGSPMPGLERKTPLAAVGDARLGMGNPSIPPHGGPLGSVGMGMGTGRMVPAHLDDALSRDALPSAGRAKVRPGLKLEPLN